MAEVDLAALNDRYVKALNDGDWGTLNDLFTPDCISDWPQSRERVRGMDNFRRIYEFRGRADPSVGPANEMSQLFVPAESWAISPMFTTIRVTRDVERFTSIVRGRYPNNEIWYVISIFEVRDGRISHATQFFAPTYDAPEWRSAWAEPLDVDPGRAP